MIQNLDFKSKAAKFQATPEALTQDILAQGEGKQTASGAIAINTGKFTGRSPLDRFIVKDDITRPQVDWEM